MKLLNLRVQWMKGYANSPGLKLLVDEYPTDLVYKSHKGLWFAEKDGYVRFYSWTGPGNEGGFGGSCFNIQTAEGPVTLKGPWSSRSGVMNAYFPHCLEVSFGSRAGAVTVEWLMPYLAQYGLDLYKETRHGELYYVPTLLGHTPEESKLKH